MDNNNEQEDGFDVINAINDDNGGDLFERIYLGQTLVNIPDVPFRLIIDASVTVINEQACFGCTTLIEVIFHNKVITIGKYAFWNCRNLRRIELPAGLFRLEDWAFRGCTSLREIVIPASVQYIGPRAFCWCESLQRVVFASRKASIELGGSMFWRCSNLRFVTLPQNLQSIPAMFFGECTSLTHLQIPASVEEIGVEALYGSGIQATKILEEDKFVPGTIMLPPKLHSISERCFMNCLSFTNIRIPPSVEEIGEWAFRGSGLRSITISENINQIGPEACRDCSSLEKVTFHSSTNLIMDNDIFANCSSLSVIKMYPWLWPKLFVSMNGHPEFIFKFFRHYHTKILDFDTPDVRLVRRLRRDRKRTATMMDDG